ncbi:MAG: hypothetical protein CV089_18045 [Nitrospira sp. WS110]|nr:hypothetical protein [Nitrospira sp. WS110]
MVVQVRQAPWKDSRWVSVTPAVALNVNGDRIMIEYDHDTLLLRINGKSTDLKEHINLPKGGVLVPEGRGYLIGWPDGSVLRVLRNIRGLDLSMGLAEGRKGTVSGLLGPFTGNHASAIVTKAGASIKLDEINYKRLYREYGDSWRITQAESLFDYEAGKSTKTYDDRTFPDPNPPKMPPATENSARAICERAGVPQEALAGCILDVAVTGEEGFAMTTAAAMRPLASPLPVERAASATKDQSNAQTFTLTLGDHVAVDKPGKGAGRIEMAGAVDQYTFSALAGTVVYFKSEPPCTNKDLHWSVRNASGNYESRAGLENICEDIGRIQLKDGGTYTITVAGRKDSMATGNYGFALLPVAADQTFSLKIGDHVAVDKPSKGAGRIEMAGAIDQYTFTAQAGTVVYFKSEPPCTNQNLYWSVVNASGDYVSRFGNLNSICGDIGRTLLEDGGTYTIIVKGRGNATGDYGFALQYDHK